MKLGYDDYDAIIHDRLYQGSAPFGEPNSLSKEHGFDVVVLCATENVDRGQYTDIEVIEAIGEDVNDWPVNEEAVKRWNDAALKVAQHVNAGRRVLVTCMAGLNRSGFVSALTLYHVWGWSGDRAIKHIQERREDALFRKAFCRHLSAFVMEKT